MYTNEEQLKAAYALNLCTVSVAQIIDYNDIGIMDQEYENILNNLNLERIIKSEALRSVFDKIMDTIVSHKIAEGDKKQIDLVYQHKVKNAMWSAVPQLGMIFATSNPIALSLTLASQVGISYMNYRRNKADYQLGREQEYWQLQRGVIREFGGLQQELFNTAWQLAAEYKFPDEYRLTDKQVHQYNIALTESNPIKRYNNLDSMKTKFDAYPHFWYQMGSTANSIYHDSSISNNIRDKYKRAAIDCFQTYKELNKFNVLRNDAITSAWALEYIDLLDLSCEKDRTEAAELLQIAQNHADSDDVLELCAYAYLKLRDYSNASRIFKALVSRNYNIEMNAQILSAIYIHTCNPYNPQNTAEMQAKAAIDYEELPRNVQRQYILHMPTTEDEWAKWNPMWEAHDANDADEAEKATSQDFDSSQVEKSIANVMGWVANHGGFDAISVTETDDYYIVEYESSPQYGTLFPIGKNEMPSLIRINKRTGQVATNCKISTDKFYRRISDYYWKKRLSYVCGNNIYKNIDGNLVCLNAEHFNGWKTLADIGIDKIPQGCTGHILFERDNKIYDFTTSLKQCKELCAVPSIADYFVTSEGIYILSGTPLGEVMFYSYEKKQIVPLFKVDGVNRICYVKDNVFFFIEEGYYYSPGRIKKVSLSASRRTEEIIYDDLPDCYGIGCDPSFVVPYKDCILYANKAGFLKKLSYDSDIVEDITRGLTCETRHEEGVFRKKYKYNQIPAGFVCIGNWVYFYQDGRRDRPARVSLDAPNEIEFVPAYDNLENAQVIEQLGMSK